MLDKQLQPELLFFYTILHPASMIRKTVLIDNNIRYEEEFSPAEDYALWGRLIGKTKFANIPEVLFFYRGHETNTSKIQAKKMKEGVEKIYKFMHEENPELYSNSYTKKEIRLFNIPVFSYERKACTHYYKLFNCIKFKRKDKIKYQ